MVRYVLLCEWGKSSTKLTMNLSIKTSCFQSKTHTVLSQVVDGVGQGEAPPPLTAAFMYMHRHCRWVNFGYFAKACRRKFMCSGFLLFMEQQGAHKYYSLTKKSGACHISFNHQRSAKTPGESNAKMYVNQIAWRHGANLKALLPRYAVGPGAPQAINACMYVCVSSWSLWGAEQMSACG